MNNIAIYFSTCCLWLFVDRIVQNVLDSTPKTKYIIAVDDSNNTLEEITRVGLDLMID